MENIFQFKDENKLSRKFFYLGLISSILSYLGYINNVEHFYHSYLVSWVFWMTLSGGCMFFVMMHFAMNATIGGQWKKDSSIILQQGDAILYRGCEVYHSRDRLKYHRSRHLLLHYVERGSAIDNKDGRTEYGINNITGGYNAINSKRRIQQ